MTPEERAVKVMEDARSGPIADVSPKRTEALIAQAIREAVAEALFQRGEADAKIRALMVEDVMTGAHRVRPVE